MKILQLFIIFFFLLYQFFIQKKIYSFQGNVMGTSWKVYLLNINKKKYNKLLNSIYNKINKNEELISIWKDKSLIFYINKSYKKKITKKISNIVKISLYIEKKTEKTMSITSGRLVDLWGFGPKKKIIL